MVVFLYIQYKSSNDFMCLSQDDLHYKHVQDLQAQLAHNINQKVVIREGESSLFSTDKGVKKKEKILHAK